MAIFICIEEFNIYMYINYDVFSSVFSFNPQYSVETCSGNLWPLSTHNLFATFKEICK